MAGVWKLTVILGLLFGVAWGAGVEEEEGVCIPGDESCVSDEAATTDEVAMLQSRLKLSMDAKEEVRAPTDSATKIQAPVLINEKTNRTREDRKMLTKIEKVATHVECPSNPEDTKAYFARLDTLADVTSAGDTLFPATTASLGGDLSTKYNSWSTMAQISGDSTGAVQVFGSGGPAAGDIGQGKSGTCYLLAALAAVANTHPAIIQNMFVDQDLWASGIFTSTWFVFGKPIKVAVDNMLPADPTTHSAYFAKPNNGVFWVPILQKAWAKIFGDYHKSESGQPGDVFKCLTQAPLQLLKHSVDGSMVWDKLAEATANKYPAAGSSKKGAAASIGLAEGHAYTVLRTVTDIAGHDHALELYNPWSHDYYNGVLASQNTDHGDGKFFITLDEYLAAFEDTYISKVLANGVVSSIQHYYDPEEPVFMEIKATGDFSLMLDYPDEAKTGCHLQVQYHNDVSDDESNTMYAITSTPSYSNIRWDLTGGKTYQVSVNPTFLENDAPASRYPWFSFVTYGTEELDISPKCIDRLEKFGGSGRPESDYHYCAGMVNGKSPKCNKKFDNFDKYYNGGGDPNKAVKHNCQSTCGAPGRGCLYGKSPDSQCDSIAHMGYIPIESSTNSECKSAAEYVKNEATTPDTYCSGSYPGACHDYQGYLDYCSHVNPGVQKSKVHMICKLASLPTPTFVTSAGLQVPPTTTTTTTTTTTLDPSECVDGATSFHGCLEYAPGTRRRYSCAKSKSDAEQCNYYATGSSYCSRADGVEGDNRRRRRYAMDAYDNCKASCGLCR